MACLAEVAYRVDYAESSYILNTLYNLPPMASNGCAHYRIRTNLTVTWFWLLALSLTQLQHREETALAIWDESVLEKPDGIALEGLCPVRASKAPASRASSLAFTILREDRPCSCPRCNGSPP